jgi:hypothetical protein
MGALSVQDWRAHFNYKFMRGYKNGLPVNLGRKHTEKWKKRMKLANSGIKNYFFGKHHSEETKRILSELNKGKHSSPSTEYKKGHIPWTKGKKGIFLGDTNPFYGKKHTLKLKNKLSEFTKKQWESGLFRKEDIRKKRIESFKKVRNTAEWNKKMPKGKNHPNWKGGVTPLIRIIRESSEYKKWRQSIYERDNWTCQKCNERGGELIAHHIKLFSQSPELRFAINNGITLCRKCHNKKGIHKWSKDLFT